MASKLSGLSSVEPTPSVPLQHEGSILRISPEILARIAWYLSPLENGWLLTTCKMLFMDPRYRGEIEAMFRIEIRTEANLLLSGLKTSIVILSNFKRDVEQEIDGMQLQSIERSHHHLRVILLRLFLSLTQAEFNSVDQKKCGRFVITYEACKRIREQEAEGFQAGLEYLIRAGYNLVHPTDGTQLGLVIDNLIDARFISEAAEMVMKRPTQERDPLHAKTVIQEFCKERRFSVAIEFNEAQPAEEQLDGFGTISFSLIRVGHLFQAIALTKEKISSQKTKKSDDMSDCNYQDIGAELLKLDRFSEAEGLGPLITDPIKQSSYWEGFMTRLVEDNRFSEAMTHLPKITNKKRAFYMSFYRQTYKLKGEEQKAVLIEMKKQVHELLSDEKEQQYVLSFINKALGLSAE